MPSPDLPRLDDEERRLLIDVAWASIRHGLASGVPSPVVPRDYPPRLREPGAAFVTLHARGALRGCIGHIEPDMPLYRAIARSAVNAATDPRFVWEPIRPDELKDLDLEVSVLTPPRPVPGPEDIVLGRHGIIIEKNGTGATFLPKVATEQGWTREETLRHLCRKAGLGPDDWKSGMKFSVYEAIVFGRARK